MKAIVFTTETRSKSEEGLKLGEAAVAEKAIVFTAEIAEGRGENLKSGEGAVTIKTINAVSRRGAEFAV